MPIGPQVEVVDRNPPRSAPTDTAVTFIAGIAERGPVGQAVAVTSMARKLAVFGARQAWDTTSDAIETAFEEGASTIYVSRVVGPAAVAASVAVFDQLGSASPADVAFTVSAKNPGDWGNSLTVTITVQGTSFTVAVSHAVTGLLEVSPPLADPLAAKAWADDVSRYVNIALGVSNEDPRAQGPLSLAGGTGDRPAIGDPQWQAALAAFSRSLGPGQVIVPGRTTTLGHAQIAAHCLLNNRVGLLDLPVTGDVLTLVAVARALPPFLGSHLCQFAGATPAIIPGVVAGTSRTVPYSAVQAGLVARSDTLNSPNVAAAGDNGIARYAYDLAYHFTDDQYDQLRAAGIAPAVIDNDQVKTYGTGSAADPVTKPLWTQFPGARLLMAIRAECRVVAAHRQFNQIDGRGKVFGKLASDLIGQVLLPYYQADSLFGATPEEAFRVDAGPQVNTPETIAAGYIKAAVSVRISPAADFVTIEIARQAITQAP